MSGRQKIPVVLNGPGKVGMSFVRLLHEKTACIEEKTGKEPVLVAVRGRTGSLVSLQGLSWEEVVRWRETGDGSLPDGSETPEGAAYEPVLRRAAYEMSHPGVVVEATPTDLFTGEPGLSHLTKAMALGFSAVTLAKGPLVVAMEELLNLSREKGVVLRYSGAVAAALPTVDTALYCMAGTGIIEIEAVLNGTTNLILNRMACGRSYREALAEAQAMGVAEANPVLDVEGYDSAAKILIIANSIWKTGEKLDNIKRQGIAGLEAAEVVRQAANGTPVRLIARARVGLCTEISGRPGQDFTGAADLSVRPEPVASDHPFRFLPGTAKAIRFRSEEMGDIVVSGGASDVVGAAASAIKDLIHIMGGTGV